MNEKRRREGIERGEKEREKTDRKGERRKQRKREKQRQEIKEEGGQEERKKKKNEREREITFAACKAREPVPQAMSRTFTLVLLVTMASQLGSPHPENVIIKSKFI